MIERMKTTKAGGNRMASIRRRASVTLALSLPVIVLFLSILAASGEKKFPSWLTEVASAAVLVSFLSLLMSLTIWAYVPASGRSAPEQGMPKAAVALGCIAYVFLLVSIPLFFGLDGGDLYMGLAAVLLGFLQLPMPWMIHRKTRKGEYGKNPEQLNDDVAWCMWQLFAWGIVLIAIVVPKWIVIPDGIIKPAVASAFSVIAFETLGVFVQREIRDLMDRKTAPHGDGAGDETERARSSREAVIRHRRCGNRRGRRGTRPCRRWAARHRMGRPVRNAGRHVGRSSSIRLP